MRDRYNDRRPERPGLRGDSSPPMPEWLASRTFYPGEEASWVRGPSSAPWWEQYLTHPLAFFLSLPPAAICLMVGRVSVPSWAELPPAAGVGAMLIVFGTLMSIAFLTGYFTRLVVTDRRLLIIQGQTAIRSWGIHQLPRSLVKYARRADGGDDAPSIDLGALETMLGGKSDGIIDSNAIMALGKKLDRIRPGDDPR